MSEKVFSVDGYVRNEGKDAHFKLQRPLRPNSKITFAQAYAAVGKKSGKDGEEFVVWLRENFFPEADWAFYNADGSAYAPKAKAGKKAMEPKNPKVAANSSEAAPAAAPGRGAGKSLRRTTTAPKTKGVDITAEVMISAEFESARQLIDACKDRRELKKALTLSRQVSKKEEHMRYLHGRLQQVF
jgi:hypothetical protein